MKGASQMVESVARQTSSTARPRPIHPSVSSKKMITVRSDSNGEKYSQAASNSMRSASVPPARNVSQLLEFEERSERPVSETPKDGTTYETRISYASNNAGNVSKDPRFSSHGNPLPSTSQNATIHSKSNRSSLVTYSSLLQNNLPGTEEYKAHNVSIDENTRVSNHSYIDLPDLHTNFNAHPVEVLHQDATGNFSSGLNSQSTAVIDKTEARRTERAPGVALFPFQDLTTQTKQTDNLQNPTSTIMSNGYNGKENLSTNRVIRIPPVKDQITMTEFNKFKNELSRELEARNRALVDKIDELDRTMRRPIANNGNYEDRYDVPNGIPFRTLDDFENFESGEGLAKQELKSYLRFIGGVGHKDAVNQFLKETVTDALVSEFTWVGGIGKQKPKGTTFAKTLHGALSCCNLRKLSAAEFAQAMQHGLHVAKQRARDRNRVRHPNDEASNEEEYSEDDSDTHDSGGDDSVAEDRRSKSVG